MSEQRTFGTTRKLVEFRKPDGTPVLIQARDVSSIAEHKGGVLVNMTTGQTYRFEISYEEALARITRQDASEENADEIAEE